MKIGRKFVVVRLFYPSYTLDPVRPRQNNAFRKVGECLYRYSSNGVYYARFERGSKEVRRSLRTTDRASAQPSESVAVTAESSCSPLQRAGFDCPAGSVRHHGAPAMPKFSRRFYLASTASME